MAPSARRTVAYAAAGAITAAGAGFALVKAYGAIRRRQRDAPDPELQLPGDGRPVELVTEDGGLLNAVEFGSGPPLVLLHGAGLSSEVWAYQVRDLAEQCRVMVVDLRGHGGSAPGADGVTIAAMAGDVAALLEHLDLNEVVLAGHSMGGMVIQRLCRREPATVKERVSAVALLATTGGVDIEFPAWERLSRAVGRVVGAGSVLLRGNRPTVPGGDLGFLASRIGFGHAPRSDQVRETLRLLRQMDPLTYAALFPEIFGFDERPAFVGLGDLRVAVAVGSSDRLTPPSHGRRLAAAFGSASYEELEGAGHMLMYERRSAVSALLAALVARGEGERLPRLRRPGPA